MKTVVDASNALVSVTGFYAGALAEMQQVIDQQSLALHSMKEKLTQALAETKVAKAEVQKECAAAEVREKDHRNIVGQLQRRIEELTAGKDALPNAKMRLQELTDWLMEAQRLRHLAEQVCIAYGEARYTEPDGGTVEHRIWLAFKQWLGAERQRRTLLDQLANAKVESVLT